jgi:predicted MFS family arabinose efflux permease
MPILILISAFLEGLALTLIQGFLPLYLRRSLGEPQFVTVGLVVAVPAFGTVIASNFWGGLSDVSGRLKPMILVGLAGYATALIGVAFLGQGVAILACVGFASLFYGTLAPSLKAYMTLTRPKRPENAIAYILMSQSVGWLVGSYGAGGLLEEGLGTGMRAALWLSGGLLAVHAVIVTVALRDFRRDPGAGPAPPGAPRARGWLEGVLADLRAIYENPRLLRLCALAFFFVAGNYLMWGFFTVYLVEHLGASIRAVRVALVASSILGIASFLWVGPLVRRLGGRTVLAIGVTLYAVMYAGFATARDVRLVSLYYALPLYSLVNVSANALAAEYSSAAQRGGGLGVLNGTYAMASIVGPVTGGLLADRAGLGATPWASFGFLCLAIPFAWALASHQRRNAG